MEVLKKYACNKLSMQVRLRVNVVLPRSNGTGYW